MATGQDNRIVAFTPDDVEHLRRVFKKEAEELVDRLLQPYVKARSKSLLNRDMLKRPTVIPANTDTEITELVVGGKVFLTTPTTLLQCRGSNLAKAFAGMKHFDPDLYRIFVDRDPTHFGRILQYFRDSHDSLAWLRNPALSIAEIEEVQEEAKYYGLKTLYRILHWEVVNKGPVMKNVITDACKSRAITETSRDSSRPSESTPVKYRSLVNLNWPNKNFTGVKFEKVAFHHTVKFNGSVLAGAVFTSCVFRADVDFTECYMVETSFVDCVGPKPPADTFTCKGAKGAECIPPSW